MTGPYPFALRFEVSALAADGVDIGVHALVARCGLSDDAMLCVNPNSDKQAGHMHAPTQLGGHSGKETYVGIEITRLRQ